MSDSYAISTRDSETRGRPSLHSPRSKITSRPSLNLTNMILTPKISCVMIRSYPISKTTGNLITNLVSCKHSVSLNHSKTLEFSTLCSFYRDSSCTIWLPKSKKRQTQSMLTKSNKFMNKVKVLLLSLPSSLEIMKTRNRSASMRSSLLHTRHFTLLTNSWSFRRRVGQDLRLPKKLSMSQMESEQALRISTNTSRMWLDGGQRPA